MPIQNHVYANKSRRTYVRDVRQLSNPAPYELSSEIDYAKKLASWNDFLKPFTIHQIPNTPNKKSTSSEPSGGTTIYFQKDFCHVNSDYSILEQSKLKILYNTKIIESYCNTTDKTI